jgi:DNA-binding IclR family transcriptional regulator
MSAIGKRTRQILELIASPATPREISRQIGIDPSSTHRCCKRAVSYGLMRRVSTDPIKYQALPDWRELVESVRKPGRTVAPEINFAPLQQAWLNEPGRKAA